MELKFAWQTIGSSCQGAAHRRLGLPNQDRWLHTESTEHLLVAVADGMGSCPKARLGAWASCQAFHAVVQELLEAGRGELIVDDPRCFFRRAVELRAEIIQSAGAKLYEADSTGLVAFFFEDRVLLAQLGDGLVLALDILGRPLRMFSDAKEDSFLNQVKGFGGSVRVSGWKASVLPQFAVESVLLCTDGVELASAADYVHLAQDLSDGVAADAAVCQHSLHRLLSGWPNGANQDDKTLAFVAKSISPGQLPKARGNV